MENNGVLKGILILGLILYVISPVDLCPGPVDDILLILFSIAANRRQDSGSYLPERNRSSRDIE